MTAMTKINCDLGECLKPDPDSTIMPLINMANIASGGHAGDQSSMSKTILLAKQYGVTIGIHPSYQDKANFGRISHDLSTQQLVKLLSEQIAAFVSLCQQYDMEAHYIKPHGALYHDMMHKPEVLMALCQCIADLDYGFALVVQAGIESEYFESVSQQTGIPFLYEAFADRQYQGTKLTPRTQAGAVLSNPEQIIEQYHRLSARQDMHVDTICFHSDNPASVKALTRLNESVDA